MKVKILGVERSPLGQDIVVFSSSAGIGRALWKSLFPPQPGLERTVELDLSGTLEDYIEEASDATGYSVSLTDNGCKLRGLLESIDPDGMAYLRLGHDCLVMVQSEPTSALVCRWVCLMVPTTDVTLTA
jgi:hypothetical protein